MKNYKIIGLTGQSGAGKSTVADIMKELGFYIIDADDIVSALYLPKSDCLKMVSAVFGDDIICSDGTLNRELLAKRAFSSRDNTEKLNKAVHPFVIAEFLKEVKQVVKKGERLIVFDAPQLFESNADVVCDIIISVTASPKIRLERICKRDGINREQALQRMNAQLDEEFFISKSDYVIENNKALTEVKALISDIISKL